jgi:hypothetical protein
MRWASNHNSCYRTVIKEDRWLACLSSACFAGNMGDIQQRYGLGNEKFEAKVEVLSGRGVGLCGVVLSPGRRRRGELLRLPGDQAFIFIQTRAIQTPLESQRAGGMA